jgi:hypothetical protein
MDTCQNQAAARHALPDTAMPVSDRKMTLTVPCHEPAEYYCSLRGVGVGKARKGGLVQRFSLCENHSVLFEQIDVELVQDAWMAAYAAKPERIPV